MRIDDLLLVSIITHSCAIATDFLVVVLTWMKTFEIRKIAAEMRVKASLTNLLLRDGTVYFGYLYHHFSMGYP